MYKTVQTTLVTGQTFSPIVPVPGRLIGYATNADTAATVSLRVNTPNGLAVLANASGNNSSATLGAGGGGAFINVPPNMPVGNMEYAVVFSVAQTSDRTIIFYYEDLPGVY